MRCSLTNALYPEKELHNPMNLHIMCLDCYWKVWSSIFGWYATILHWCSQLPFYRFWWGKRKGNRIHILKIWDIFYLFHRLIFLFQELLVSNCERTMIKTSPPIFFSCSNTSAVYFDLNVIYPYVIIVLMLLHSTDAIHLY